MNSAQTPACGERLETWKAVAAFFGKDERTVKRWEAMRGLPVHRMPGGRSRIYANAAELEAWRDGASGGATSSAPAFDLPAPHAAQVEAAPARPAIAARWRLRITGVLLAAGVAGFGARLVYPVLRARLHHPPAEARALYTAGMADLASRTPLGLNRAVLEFEAATARDHAYAAAYAGLAETYDLLRQYTATPPTQAYPLAREAALRALALDPDLADAHSALAFADYWGFWDARAARAHFRRALQLDPQSVLAHHWYATFLVNRGEAAEALRQIDTALRLAPTSQAILANRAFILANVGREPEAVAILRRLAAANPTFLSPHQYLSGMAYDLGDDVTFLDERAKAAALLGSREAQETTEAARRALASGGRQAMTRVILASETTAFLAGRGSAYEVARLHAQLGEADGAGAWLRLAFERRETQCLAFPTDLAFAPLRKAPQMAGLFVPRG